MKSGRFFAGATRSYWDLYFRYGLIAAGVCVVEAILLWELGRVVRADPLSIRPIVALLVVANVGHALLVARYFVFVVPIVFDVLIAALLIGAYVVAGSGR